MTRLAALPPPTDGTRTDASAEQPQYCTPTLPGWPARPSVPPYCMQAQTAQSLVMHASLPPPSPVTAPNSLPAPSMAAQFMKGYAVPAAMPDYQRPSPSLRGAPAAAPPFHQHEPLPLQHMLVVAGMPGRSGKNMLPLHHEMFTGLRTVLPSMQACTMRPSRSWCGASSLSASAQASTWLAMNRWG